MYPIEQQQDPPITPLNHPKSGPALIASPRDNLIIALILAFVIIAWMIDSVRHSDHLNNDMHVVATMVAKDLNPNLYLRDVNYASDELYRFYTPLYRWLLGKLWQLTGEFEWGLIWLTPFVLGAYLLGMYWLLMRVTQNPWLSLGVTIASAGYYETMGQEIWGSGDATLMLARTIYTATVPYLTLLILTTWRTPSWRNLMLLGLGLGLTANLHPPSGLHLTIAVMSTLVLLFGFKSGWPHFWLKLGLMAFATLLGVGPTLLNYVGGTSNIDLGSGDFQTLHRIVSEWYEMPFRPLEIKFSSLGLILAPPQLEIMVWIGLIVGLLALGLYFFALPIWPGLKRWLWLGAGLLTVWYAYTVALFNLTTIFLLVAIYIIYCFYRHSITWFNSVLIAWVALIAAQSLLGYYFIVKLWEYSELASLTTLVGEQPRAARFIYLPIYLLVGLAGVALVKTIAHRQQVNQRGLTGISVSVGLLIALSPGLSEVLSVNWWLGLTGLMVALTCVALLVWWTSTQNGGWLTRWGIIIGLIGIIIILFGPLAPILGPYLHLPTVNLLDPVSRTPDLRYQAHDQALYTWVKTETEQDALFFWCEFGPTTTLHFRLKAERGLTHHWRDLNQRTYNPGTLAVHHQRYRQYERACDDLFTAVSVAAESEADFILVPSDQTADFKAESCFFNDRYAVFPVASKFCPAD